MSNEKHTGSADYADEIKSAENIKQQLVERTAVSMDGVLKLYERDGDENIVSTKFVNLANCCCAYVTEERTVLIMANRDTITIPNVDGNPFYENTQSSSEG